MKIEEKKVVTFHYTLKNPQGDLLDTSDGGEPLAYIHGMRNIIAGLEAALEGKEAGEKLSVTIHPQDAYGMMDEELIKAVPLSQFPEKDAVKPGAQFQLSSGTEVRIATVVKVENEEVTIDLNHPLAGQTLCFDVEIVGVRDAAQEELDHGHVHGPGGHHH
ncbi:MAG: peptidylprolyl isomerase [Candidatus Omnitrophica bacterium]|nr:peptidylprolyl isomerase [Candidatus Omnitrophota bacterium]